MLFDLERETIDAVRKGFSEAVQKVLGGYQSPIEKMVKDAVEAQGGAMRALLTEAISESLVSDEFRQKIKEAVRHKLAQQLIQKFGGELEKQVNMLKSDPTTRAQITLAIAEIVDGAAGRKER